MGLDKPLPASHPGQEAGLGGRAGEQIRILTREEALFEASCLTTLTMGVSPQGIWVHRLRQPYDTPEIPARERLEWPPRKLRSHCWVFQRCLSLWFRLIWESGPIPQGSVQAPFWILLSHPFSAPTACFHPPPPLPPFLLFLSLSPCLSQTLTSADRLRQESRCHPPKRGLVGRGEVGQKWSWIPL